jgi:hypothetical protein
MHLAELFIVNQGNMPSRSFLLKGFRNLTYSYALDIFPLLIDSAID